MKTNDSIEKDHANTLFITMLSQNHLILIMFLSPSFYMHMIGSKKDFSLLCIIFTCIICQYSNIKTLETSVIASISLTRSLIKYQNFLSRD